MDNRRKTVVINKPFQYQYSLFIVALTILGTNIFLILQMLLPGEQPLVITNAMTAVIGGIELFLIMGVWYGSLKLTHRIAGPVYVISREVEKLGKGNLNAQIYLRDKDAFQEEVKTMNASFAELRARVAALQELAGKIDLTQGEAHNDNENLIRELADGLKRLNTHGAP